MMGEAKRRRDQGELKQDHPFARVEAEGAGVWRLEILDVMELASAHNPWAALEVFVDFVKTIQKAPQPPLCLTCDNETTREPRVVALLSGYCDNPTQMLVSAVCHICAAKSHDVLRSDAMARYREIIPGAKEVSIHPSSGRA